MTAERMLIAFVDELVRALKARFNAGPPIARFILSAFHLSQPKENDGR